MKRVRASVLTITMLTATPPSAGAATVPILTPAGQPTETQQCPAGSFLAGIQLQLTDRLIGGTLVCRSYSTDGHWQPNMTQVIFGVSNAADSEEDDICPKDYLIVGFTLTTGTYHGRSGVWATKTSPVISDLAPGCRDATQDTLTFPPSRLTKAEDNALVLTRWNPSAPPRSCPRGTAGTGLAIYSAQESDWKPKYYVYGASLICGDLPVAATFHRQF